MSDGAPRRVAVLGLGNVLLGDDALGPYAVRLFEARYELPERVPVLDLGTPGLGHLFPYFEETDALVLVDTVRSEAPPGTLRLYRRDEILKHPPQPRVSPHDPELKETLLSFFFTNLDEFAYLEERDRPDAAIDQDRLQFRVGTEKHVSNRTFHLERIKPRVVWRPSSAYRRNPGRHGPRPSWNPILL